MTDGTREPTGQITVHVQATGPHPVMSQPSWWEWFSAWAARAQLVKLAVVGVFGGGVWGAVMLVWTCRGWFDGLATKAELNAAVMEQRVEMDQAKLQLASDAASIRDLRADIDSLGEALRWQGDVLTSIARKQGLDVPPIPHFKRKGY